jgi:hypothetical protein
MMAERDHPLSDFVDVRLYSAEKGIVARSNHGDPKVLPHSEFPTTFHRYPAAEAGVVIAGRMFGWLGVGRPGSAVTSSVVERRTRSPGISVLIPFALKATGPVCVWRTIS